MKMNRKLGCFGTLLAIMVLMFGMTVQAKGNDTIKTGIFAGNIDLSGKTASEATAAIEAYVEELKPVEITLLAAGDKEVKTTAGDLGIIWANPELVAEAMELGRDRKSTRLNSSH